MLLALRPISLSTKPKWNTFLTFEQPHRRHKPNGDFSKWTVTSYLLNLQPWKPHYLVLVTERSEEMIQLWQQQEAVGQ